MAALKLEVPPPPRALGARRTITRARAASVQGPRNVVGDLDDDTRAKRYCRALEAALLAAAARNRGMMRELAVLRAARAAAGNAAMPLHEQYPSFTAAGDGPDGQFDGVYADCVSHGVDGRSSGRTQEGDVLAEH